MLQISSHLISADLISSEPDAMKWHSLPWLWPIKTCLLDGVLSSPCHIGHQRIHYRLSQELRDLLCSVALAKLTLANVTSKHRWRVLILRELCCFLLYSQKGCWVLWGICLSVCLSVCLFARITWKYTSELYQILLDTKTGRTHCELHITGMKSARYSCPVSGWNQCFDAVSWSTGKASNL